MSIFNFLGNDKNYIHAGVAFFLAGFFGFLSLIMLGTIAAAPDKFVVCFTFAIFSYSSGAVAIITLKLGVTLIFRANNALARL